MPLLTDAPAHGMMPTVSKRVANVDNYCSAASYRLNDKKCDEVTYQKRYRSLYLLFQSKCNGSYRERNIKQKKCGGEKIVQGIRLFESNQPHKSK